MLALEPCPENLAREEHPQYGGSLFFRENGTACCIKCGWAGVPTLLSGYAQTWCPSCQRDPDVPENRILAALKPLERSAVPRNKPCDCGSGIKAKKCCYA